MTRIHRCGSSRFLIVLGLLGLLAGLAAFSGCAANSSARSQSDRAKHMLDEHQYGAAVEILEEQHRAHPTDKSVALLLAQAHLGAAGVELFDFITQVFGTQPANDTLDLFQQPQCSTEAIARIQGYDMRCIAVRVLRRLPNADNPHLARARAVLRESFNEASKTPTDVNFLGAFIELGSAFGRLKALLKRTLVLEVREKAELTPGELPFGFVIHHLKRFFTELTQGFIRARYSYGKVNKYVVGYEGMPLVKVGNNRLVFNADIGVPQLARFAAAVLHDSADRVDEQLSHTIEQNTQNVGEGLLHVLSMVDHVSFQDDAKSRLLIAFHFERSINGLLDRIAGNAEHRPTVDVFGTLWGSPPRIVRNLREAAVSAWETEDSEPLRRYFQETKSQWNDLNDIMLNWETWMRYNLDRPQQDALTKHFAELGGKKPELFRLPVQMTSETMRAWQNRVETLLIDEMTKILNHEYPGIPALSPDAIGNGFYLLSRSRNWIDANLWPLN